MGIWRFYGNLSALLLLYLFGLFVMMVYTTSLSLRILRYAGARPVGERYLSPDARCLL